MPTTISVKDSGGSSQTIATLDATNALIGEVQSSPTSNTMLDRLKTLNTSVGTVNTSVGATNTLIGEVQASPTSNTVLDRLKTINTTLGSLNVGGYATNPSANFNRPADTSVYASGDLIANSTTAGSVTPLSWTAARTAAGSFTIRRARLKKSGTTTTNATFRLHLYSASPTFANGDNAAWSTTESGYLGSFDLDMTAATARVFSDSAKVISAPSVGTDVTVKLASGQTIYGVLEARAAYTPASTETFTVELEVIQN